ncbi:hypothetical protein GW17_00057082, partial [Ensete ventricosum]
MRLNSVKSFYAFLLYFRSQQSEERGWLAIARPSARVANHGQALYGGSHKRPGLLARAAARGQPARGDACQRLGRRGNARSQPTKGRRPPAREVPSRAATLTAA